VKIAIVGSGISGMTCGHLLAPHHDVTLFEADHRLGGHTHTHQIEVASGKYLVDTGFIVHNDKNYPNFLKLMHKLGVTTQKSSMSFSVKVEKSGLEYNGTSLNTLFCQRRNILNPNFYRMIKDILRFNKEATKYFLEHRDQDDTKTLETYLRENRYSEEFTEYYIMPMGAAIWSASREEMRKFPLGFFVRFFHHHGMLSVDDRPKWRVLKGGSHAYIKPLTESFQRNIRLSTPVLEVSRSEKKVVVRTPSGVEDFDQVIFATHADQTKRTLTNMTPEERTTLSGFDYRPNDVTLHTDTSILPRSVLGHAAWNYYLPEQERERVAVTYHMNILQGIQSPEKFLVSLNMDEMIDPKKIIKKIPYSHPVYTLEAVKSQRNWKEISGKDRIHFCGAYWGNGFHEDGVTSAFKVAQTFGVSL